MPTELHTTNIWLAVTAIAVALQTLFLFAAAIFGLRMYRKIENAVQDVETRYVAPAEARLTKGRARQCEASGGQAGLGEASVICPRKASARFWHLIDQPVFSSYQSISHHHLTVRPPGRHILGRNAI